MQQKQIKLLNGQSVFVTKSKTYKNGKTTVYKPVRYQACQKHASHIFKKIQCPYIQNNINLAQRQYRGNNAMKKLQESLIGTPDAHLLNNIVNVCDVRMSHGQVSDKTEVIMENAQGQSLKQFLNENKLNYYDIFKIYKTSLQIFKCFREKSFLHRDVKPHNLFINKQNGQINFKYIDFGNSKQLDQMLTNNSTKIYFPPGIQASQKQMEGEKVQILLFMDLYALTCILWSLCFQGHIFQYSENDADKKIFEKIEIFSKQHEERIKAMYDQYECPEDFRGIFQNVFNPNKRNFNLVLAMVNPQMEYNVNKFNESIHFVERCYVRCYIKNMENLFIILSTVCQFWLRMRSKMSEEDTFNQEFSKCFLILKNLKTNLQQKQDQFQININFEGEGEDEDEGKKKKSHVWRFQEGEIMTKQTLQIFDKQIKYLQQLRQNNYYGNDQSNYKKFQTICKKIREAFFNNDKRTQLQDHVKSLLEKDPLQKDGNKIIVNIKKGLWFSFENDKQLMNYLNRNILQILFELNPQCQQLKLYQQYKIVDENSQNQFDWKHFMQFLQNS